MIFGLISVSFLFLCTFVLILDTVLSQDPNLCFHKLYNFCLDSFSSHCTFLKIALSHCEYKTHFIMFFFSFHNHTSLRPFYIEYS